MLSSVWQQALQQEFLKLYTIPSYSLQSTVISGGSINNTYKLTVNNQHTYFAKTNSATAFPQMFKKEKSGLLLLSKQQCIKTPTVIATLEAGKEQLLLLEWIQSGEITNHFWKLFGEQLAALHQSTHQFFGLNEDNYMGSVPQQNTYCHNWPQFFATQRLQPLVTQCLQKGLLTSAQAHLFEKLYSLLPEIYNDEPPALLHGDLWSGNFMCNSAGEPVLIDPAVYYGHRSADMGLTTLFGGFAPAFYESYHYHYTLPTNYKQQWQISNLYPLLIHLLLFGSSYLPQILQTLQVYN